MDATIQSASVSSERKKISRNLLIFAWIIEVFAVLIGLAIALMQGVVSYTESTADKPMVGFSGWANITIAVLPFLMVAIVELTKIPFVQAFYKSTLFRWKLIFGCCLCFIALITFESAMNGFERNYSAMMTGIDKYKKELVNVEESMVPLFEQRIRLETLTAEKIEAEYSERLKQISGERDSTANIITKRIADIRGSVQSEMTRNLEQQILDKRQVTSQLQSEMSAELSRLTTELNASLNSSNTDLRIQRENINNQLNTEIDNLKLLRQKFEKEIEDTFFNAGAVRKRANYEISAKEKVIDTMRTKLLGLSATTNEQKMRENYQGNVVRVRDDFNKRISSVDTEIRSLSSDLQRNLGQRQSDVSLQLKTHQDELSRVNLLFTEQQKQNEERRQNDLALLTQNTALITQLTGTIQQQQNKRIALRDLINQKVGDNQIYRMAQWYFDKESAADLERSQVAGIAVFWFGSLAALIAFTGILLALASCALEDPKNSDDKVSHKNSLVKVASSIRKFYVYKRRRYKEPIIREIPRDVIREIPVERVVKVEVPVEVIKKEIVHIPFYTNDKSLIEITEGHEKFVKFKGVANNA
jgi:hypothetical protein